VADQEKNDVNHPTDQQNFCSIYFFAWHRFTIPLGLRPKHWSRLRHKPYLRTYVP